jgi:hypothetical protein
MSLSHDPPDGGKKPIRPPLRLVHPSPPQTPPKPYRRTPTFTAEEQARLRAALKNARWLFGTWGCLAAAMRVRLKRVERVARGDTFTADLAVRLARALGKPLESLYRAPTDAATCPTCGARRAP